MLARAAGLAVLAALSPTALLIAAIYLGSARPRLIMSYYLTGAVIMSTAMAVVVLEVLRNLDLSLPAKYVPRDTLRIGLGVLLVAVGLVVAVRKPKAPDPARPRQGLVSRMMASPRPRSALTVGVLVFAPGATFIAAIQVIATAQASLRTTVVALAVVVVINVTLVWLPILLYLAAPAATERQLSAFNGWLRAHGPAVLAGALVVAGAFVAATGIFELVTV